MTEMKLQVFKGIKVPILNEHIWENFFRNKNRKLLKTEISIWTTLDRTVSYNRLVKKVRLNLK